MLLTEKEKKGLMLIIYEIENIEQKRKKRINWKNLSDEQIIELFLVKKHLFPLSPKLLAKNGLPNRRYIVKRFGLNVTKFLNKIGVKNRVLKNKNKSV